MRKLAKKHLEKLEAKFSLTDEEKRIVQSHADALWGEVAYDVLDAFGGRDKTVPRSTVIEIVLDAGRLEDKLKRGKVFKDHPAIEALFPKKWDNDASNYLQHLMQERFKYARYGL